MEKYRKALRKVEDIARNLFNKGMVAEGFSQLIGALNIILILASDDDLVSIEDYAEILRESSNMRDAALRRLVNENDSEQ